MVPRLGSQPEPLDRLGGDQLWRMRIVHPLVAVTDTDDIIGTDPGLKLVADKAQTDRPASIEDRAGQISSD